MIYLGNLECNKEMPVEEWFSDSSSCKSLDLKLQTKNYATVLSFPVPYFRLKGYSTWSAPWHRRQSYPQHMFVICFHLLKGYSSYHNHGSVENGSKRSQWVYIVCLQSSLHFPRLQDVEKNSFRDFQDRLGLFFQFPGSSDHLFIDESHPNQNLRSLIGSPGQTANKKTRF